MLCGRGTQSPSSGLRAIDADVAGNGNSKTTNTASNRKVPAASSGARTAITSHSSSHEEEPLSRDSFGDCSSACDGVEALPRPQQDRVVAFETEFTAVSTCAWCQQHPSTKCRAIATATAVEMMARTVITSFELTNSLGNRQGRRRNVMLILRIFQRYEALVQSTALEDSKSLHQRALTP